MKLKTVYLALCVLGLVLPYWQFVPWVAENGLNLRLMVQQLFANRISAFFGMDVIVSSVVVLVFSNREGARLGVRGLSSFSPPSPSSSLLRRPSPRDRRMRSSSVAAG